MKIIIIRHFNGRVRFIPNIFHVQNKKNIGRKAASSPPVAIIGKSPGQELN
jgi:hypothetical protein